MASSLSNIFVGFVGLGEEREREKEKWETRVENIYCFRLFEIQLEGNTTIHKANKIDHEKASKESKILV